MATYAVGKDVVMTIGGETEGIVDVSVDLTATEVDVSMRNPSDGKAGWMQSIQGMKKVGFTASIISGSPVAVVVANRWSSGDTATIAMTGTTMAGIVTGLQFVVLSISEGQPLDDKVLLDVQFAYHKGT
jgi:hypothetical protein